MLASQIHGNGSSVLPLWIQSKIQKRMMSETGGMKKEHL